MTLGTLSRIFPHPHPGYGSSLLKLFDHLENIQDLFAGLAYLDEKENEFQYISPAIEELTGYPFSNFLGTNGINFFFSITPTEYHAHILQQQIQFRMAAKILNWIYWSRSYLQIHGGLIHKNGTHLYVRCLMVALEYSQNRDTLLHLCTWQVTNNKTPKQLENDKSNIEDILTQVKAMYVVMYPEKFDILHPHPDSSFKIFYPVNRPHVTDRETLVLKLLSDGLSSKQIADSMEISFHTAESHRKSLLQKFEAKNSAQLIKKASKLFWFE